MAHDLTETNRHFYERLWQEVKLVRPERFNTWPIVSRLARSDTRRLEIGPGMRPRLPIEGTDFVDLTESAVTQLNACAGRAVTGTAAELPYEDGSFDLVAAFDIIEHVQDDEAVLREMVRVLAAGGLLLLATPLHMGRWIPFDDMVGHCRRYDPDELVAMLARHGLQVRQSAAYGMQPSSARFMNFAMWWLRRLRSRALFFFNHFYMPVKLRSQPELVLTEGMLDSANVDEVFLVCSRVL